MNKKEIVTKNIENFDYLVGYGIRGKGLEIFSKPRYVYFNTKPTNEEIMTALEKHDTDIDNVFIKEIRINTDNGIKTFNFEVNDFKKSLKQFSLQELLEKNMENVDCISIYTIPQFKTYINLSKIDISLEGQQKILKQLLEIDGYNLITDFTDYEYDSDDCFIEFKQEWKRMRYNGDYILIHGDDIAFAPDQLKRLDGRMWYYNDFVIDRFWEDIEIEDSFQYIDPENKTVIYTRKGKDWYVSPAIKHDVCGIIYRDEDGEIQENDFWYYAEVNDDVLIEKIICHMNDMKKGLEIDCLFENEIQYAFCDDDDYDGDKIFNKEILLEIYDDEIDFREEMYSRIDYHSTKDAESIVVDAYENFLMDNIKDDVLFGKFEHLKQLKELAQKDGNEIVYSKVDLFTDDKLYAIRNQNGEEYHFLLAELYNEIPEAFYKKIIENLQKREIEKKNFQHLMERAKKIFVGIDDSINAGNCKAGTIAFAKKHNIDINKIGGIRGDMLLNIENSNYTKRAVIEAMKRY